ncbi:vesicle transport protein SFT2B-like isoform X2 [Gouania willdenowi]|uniref:Vesicle transport protein n=1 Tax=Gouania willdenowi TaxID=441366 RepID=A0A8C5DB22_GOUWI|nr:vesicle transport protein SFT2B-like isoform X2 [Gouania willdenowi]
MDKLKQVLSGQDDGGDGGSSGILERANRATTLACGTRVKGFAICFILGAVCSILGACLLWIPGVGLIVFAVLYSAGNVCALGSTMFLIGPWKQLKSMCAKERFFATIIMLWKNKGLALLFCLLQFIAFTWYSLSYIPFIRDAIIKLFKLSM